MTDAHVLDLLSPYLDGEVSAPEAELVRAHLASCESCAAELASLSELRSALRALPVAPVPRSFAPGPSIGWHQSPPSPAAWIGTTSGLMVWFV